MEMLHLKNVCNLLLKEFWQCFYRTCVHITFVPGIPSNKIPVLFG